MSSFRVLYDSATNVLYVTSNDHASSDGPKGDRRLLGRYSSDGEDLLGVRVADFDTYWGSRFDALPEGVALCSEATRSAAAR